MIGLDGLVQLHWWDKDGNDDNRSIFVFMTEMTKLHSSQATEATTTTIFLLFPLPRTVSSILVQATSKH